MQQPLINVKWIDKIRENVLKIITVTPQQYRFTHLPGNNHLEFTDRSYPAHKDNIKPLPEQNKNEDMILQDIFGAINY